MSLEFSGFLYSGAGRTGKSLLVGVGVEDRYTPIRPSALQNIGLYQDINSLELFTTDAADGCLVLLENDDFSGPFAEASDAASAGDVWWNCHGTISSVLLIATQRKGRNETRLSFRSQFLQQWTTFLDQQLSGSRASRQGDPTLTWEMFPASVSYLDPNLTYLKIFQPLHISMPWPFSDYAASMTYHIELFINGDGHLRCWGARWAYWVESGIKAGHIGDSLKGPVSSGLGTLQDQVNTKLAELDALGKMTDVYYLPGSQLTPIGTAGITGNTADDVTIVIEH